MDYLTQTTNAARTTPTLHSPERHASETFKQYRERQRASKSAARSVTGTHLNGGISSRKQFRDSMRSSGTMGKRIRASDALMAAWASKRVTKAPLKDEHGAYTLIGKPYELEGVHPTTREVVRTGWVDGDDFGYTVQRKWLGGMSAQRGY